MIYSLLHKGSGAGNQLHRYIMARILALDNGWEFGTIGQENFKCNDFMSLDFGGGKDIHYRTEIGTGKIVASAWELLWEEWDKHCYDPDINFVEDDTIIDGNFEDERYFEHRLPEIKEWLKTDSMLMGDNLCVIGFRGGEYYTVPELGLPKEYYDRAISEMLKINPDMLFEVHTDDLELAKQFFPNYPIIRDIGINWRSMRYAKYAIIANSSFYLLPRLLKHYEDTDKYKNGGAPDIRSLFSVTIAPRYWNRYNTKKWDYPYGYYKSFRYI